MSKITFGYIVGGEDKHYNNLLRSLESLERIEQPYEVVILDADSRLEADEAVSYTHLTLPTKSIV